MLYAIYTQATIWMVLVTAGTFWFADELMGVGGQFTMSEYDGVVIRRLLISLIMVFVWFIWFRRRNYEVMGKPLPKRR